MLCPTTQHHILCALYFYIILRGQKLGFKFLFYLRNIAESRPIQTKQKFENAETWWRLICLQNYCDVVMSHDSAQVPVRRANMSNAVWKLWVQFSFVSAFKIVEFKYNVAIYLFIYSFIYLFVNLPVGAQLILLHLIGAQMTLAAFQEQFSFKFLPKTVIRQFWRSQCAWQRVPDPWSTHRKGTRTGSHCSRPRYSQFQMHRRTQKPTTRNRRNSDAVIGEVDGGATMETFVDQGGHLECHPP